MSLTYTHVQWNRHKRTYDACIVVGAVLLVGAFFGAGKLLWRAPNALSDEVLLIRSLALAAITLLHIVLMIGPLARLSPLFAPWLYNRRHLGVTVFLIALAHAALAVSYYGGFGGVNPISAVLASGSFRSVSAFPFEWLGLFALVVLFLMAATSHDFWLKNLGPALWKWLHMGVYPAYAAVVLHVVLGALQSERHVLLAATLLAGATLIAALHAIAALREWRKDTAIAAPNNDAWVDAAGIDEIADRRAKVVCIAGHERIALFRFNDSFSAISNVCAHQGGPLGEGRIIDGCVTCPWHGYQYLPHNGQSPPPFTEKIHTYEVRVRGNRVEVRDTPLPPGTPVPPAPRACAAASARIAASANPPSAPKERDA